MRYVLKKITIGLFLLTTSTICLSQNTLEELRKRREQTKASISETSRLLQNTKKDALSKLNRLNTITADIKSRKKLIGILEQELYAIDKEQLELQRQTRDLRIELKTKKEGYAKAMRSIYVKRNNYDKWMFILSAQSLSQSYRRLRYLREYSQWRKQQAEEIIEKEKLLVQKNEQLENIKTEKQSILDSREGEAKRLVQQEQQQRLAVNELKEQEKSLKKALDENTKQKKIIDKRISDIIAEETRKAVEKARRKAAEEAKEKAEEDRRSTPKGTEKPTSRDANRQTQPRQSYTSSKPDIELSGSFERNRGKLPMPITGNYLIVGHFGIQQHPELKNITIENNGIDIQGRPGALARCVFEGVVSKVFVVPGGYSNSSIIIRHGNYFSVYSNLTEVYIKAGDKVSTKQAIGKIYSDPEDGSRTILQFQLHREFSKLNPEPWLNR